MDLFVKMSVTSYINYHRRPHAQYMTVAEYNKKNSTNVEVPVGFQHEFESALIDARRVTDPNDFVQHSFTNMARRRRGGRRSGGRVSSKSRSGAGLSGKIAGKTYTQWTRGRIKGSVKKPRGTVPGALRNKGRSGDVKAKRAEVLTEQLEERAEILGIPLEEVPEAALPPPPPPSRPSSLVSNDSSDGDDSIVQSSDDDSSDSDVVNVDLVAMEYYNKAMENLKKIKK